MMAAGSDLPRIEVTSRAQLRAWLEANHATSGSVWLVIWKNQDPERHLPYDAIVEEALCFGWVDSVPRKLDADRSMLLLSPRKPGSAWSAANKARISWMIELGRSRPPVWRRPSPPRPTDRGPSLTTSSVWRCRPI
jgi:uncharacterized protein YdeI (YjbR/CyaY-like superfamily)